MRRLKQTEADKEAAEETARKLGQIIVDKDAKRWVETNGSFGIEREKEFQMKSDEFLQI